MNLAYGLFDSLLEPVFVFDAEQKIIYANPAAATLSGFSIRKMTKGMNFDSVLHFNEPLEVLTRLASLTESTPYKELIFNTVSGEQGKVQITLQPIAGGTVNEISFKHYVVFVRDVTLEERLQLKYRAELEQKEDVIRDLEAAKSQLEDYSKNLEQKVSERTKELSRLNQLTSALLDSLGQGFFIFNQQGLCLEIASKACYETIECLPVGKAVWDVLRLPEKQIVGFKKWMTAVFSEMLPFEDLAPLAPSLYPHAAGYHISLEYFPLRSHEGEMEGIVVVASDSTLIFEAKRQAEKDREHAQLIIHLVRSKREIARFIRDAEALFVTLNNEISMGSPDYDAVYRYLHTLKGGAASFSIQAMAKECHRAETQVNRLNEIRIAHPDQASLPSPEYLTETQVLKEMCDEIGKSFADFLSEAREILGESSLSADRQIEIPFSRLQSIIEQAEMLSPPQSCGPLLVRELLMEPVSTFFEPYGDLVQKVAEAEFKNLAPLKLIGAPIPVLPEIYSHLFATFVHSFRNAVDHGIESAEVRKARNKSPEGHIEVSFSLIDNSQALLICVKDDGGGVDPVRIRSRLAAKGFDSNQESDDEVIQHIFDSQFSTREVVTETSGRGVGMDAIRTAAVALGGKAWVRSQLGEGSSLYVQVPYVQSLAQQYMTLRKISQAA